MEKIALSKEDLDELLRLTNKAKRTPVIAIGLADGLSGRDFSAQAWENVRAKWEELGKRYNFSPQSVKGIVAETGVVLRR